MKLKKIKKNGFPLTHFWLVGLHCTIRGTRTLSIKLSDWSRGNHLCVLFNRPSNDY